MGYVIGYFIGACIVTAVIMLGIKNLMLTEQYLERFHSDMKSGDPGYWALVIGVFFAMPFIKSKHIFKFLYEIITNFLKTVCKSNGDKK